MTMKAARTRHLLAAAGLTTVVVALAATSAVAAPAAPARLLFPDVTVAPGPGGHTDFGLLVGQGVLNNVVVTYRLDDVPHGVTAVVADAEGFDCTTTSTAITCTSPVPQSPSDGVFGTSPALSLLAADTATVGETGTLHSSVRADGVPETTSDSKVTIGEGADLTAGASGHLFSAKPGGSFDTQATVHNSGTTTAHGAVLLIDGKYGLEMTKRYSNCLYGDLGAALCTFNTDLAPGQTYRFSPALAFGVSSDSLAPIDEQVSADWMTPQDWADLKATLARLGATGQPDTPGTQGVLSLMQVSAQSRMASGPQTDTNPDDNFAFWEVQVTGTNSADLAAVGATSTGTAGATVPVKIGVKNNGPATVWNAGGREAINVPLVTIPDGTTAVGVPANCAPGTADGSNGPLGKAGAHQYVCFDTTLAKAGETVWFAFTLRIDRVIDNATGSVVLYGPAEHERNQWTGDTNQSNDTASILINPTGGTGGGLPVTGVRTGLIAAAGIGLLAFGLGLRILARRRRSTTEVTD